MTFSANPFLSLPLSNDDGCFSWFKSRLQAHAVRAGDSVNILGELKSILSLSTTTMPKVSEWLQI